jgi:hypothetical protein
VVPLSRVPAAPADNHVLRRDGTGEAGCGQAEGGCGRYGRDGGRGDEAPELAVSDSIPASRASGANGKSGSEHESTGASVPGQASPPLAPSPASARSAAGSPSSNDVRLAAIQAIAAIVAGALILFIAFRWAVPAVQVAVVSKPQVADVAEARGS